MKINMLANYIRQKKGDPITLENLKAELSECLQVKNPSTQMRLHILTLKAAIEYKTKPQTK